MSSMQAVVFDNKDNLKLFGILHLPEPERRLPYTIVLLSPGVKMRVAPHRMYNKMAERYVEMGFSVFRFDFYGLGDAEGEIELKQLSNVYNTIQLGRYVDDTVSALDWLQNETGDTQFIVGGLCGGAITGMLAAENDPRIVALLALGIPVALDVGEAGWHKYLTRGQLGQLRTGYFKNMLKPASWVRLLTFQSDYRVIWKSLKQVFVKAGQKNKKVDKQAQIPESEQQEPDNTNPRFAPAFFKMLENSRPMIHVFSGNDRLAWEFEEKFVEPNEAKLKQHESLFEVHNIEHANHILSHPEWFGTMLDLTSKWLDRHFSR